MEEDARREMRMMAGSGNEDAGVRKLAGSCSGGLLTRRVTSDQEQGDGGVSRWGMGARWEGGAV